MRQYIQNTCTGTAALPSQTSYCYKRACVLRQHCDIGIYCAYIANAYTWESGVQVHVVIGRTGVRLLRYAYE